jgi:hypothetical protein
MMNNKPPAKSNKSLAALLLSLAAFSTLVGVSCGGSDERSPADSAPANQAAERKADEAQDTLNSAKRAGFTFVYVFRRPDGEALTGEDKKYLNDNSPPETNQWLLTADGKVATAGSNYKFMPRHLDALKKRFTVEDHSKPVETNAPDANANANAASRNSKDTN